MLIKYLYGIYFAAVFSWIGVIIAFFGEQSTQAGISTFKQIEGVGLVLLSAILYAAYYIYSAEEIKRTGFISFNSQVMILSSIFALISLVANGEIKETFNLQYKHLEIPFYLAVISTVLPSFFMLYGGEEMRGYFCIILQQCITLFYHVSRVYFH